MSHPLATDGAELESLRLFVALDFPETVRRDLETASRPLRRSLPRARWVRAENLHLTLCFLGETLRSLLDGLHRELSTVCNRFEPFRMAVEGVGVFPPRGPAKVVWAGLGSDGDLVGLQYAVVHAVGRAIGRSVEERRPFRPHLTLARCNPPWPRKAVVQLEEQLGDLTSEPFDIGEVHLVSSTLHPDGPRYRIVSSHPFTGPAEGGEGRPW